jgi:hypothetical protein
MTPQLNQNLLLTTGILAHMAHFMQIQNTTATMRPVIGR